MPDGALDQPVQWAHSSDLSDPTPFLEPGQVLLTTGTQFAPDDDDAFDGYVKRLTSHGLRGLGFGTEVIRYGTPDGLVQAGIRHGLPVFAVPYRTPFIALVREVASVLAEETYARQTWASKAQRAITGAALRPDGLNATLAELSRQLGSWVALYDAGGELNASYAADARVGPNIGHVGREARRLLHRGRRASITIPASGAMITLQTLGGRERLSGVLAVGGEAPLDAAGTAVVNSVIALAGLALEQNHHLNRARANLRAGLLHALLANGHDLASAISREMWGPLPQEPLTVAIASIDDRNIDAVTEFLELRVERERGTVFFARQDMKLMLCLGREARRLAPELSERFGLAVGLSEETGWADLPRAIDQAAQAQAQAARAGTPVLDFDTISRQGILAFLSGTEIRTTAQSMLAPLDAHDAAHSAELRRTLRVWLESDARFDTAAELLDVHRHTVRNRIRMVETLLGRDLRAFAVRADVWAALMATAKD
jgi:purine catabolism regulator